MISSTLEPGAVESASQPMCGTRVVVSAPAGNAMIAATAAAPAASTYSFLLAETLPAANCLPRESKGADCREQQVEHQLRSRRALGERIVHSSPARARADRWRHAAGLPGAASRRRLRDGRRRSCRRARRAQRPRGSSSRRPRRRGRRARSGSGRRRRARARSPQQDNPRTYSRCSGLRRRPATASGGRDEQAVGERTDWSDGGRARRREVCARRRVSLRLASQLVEHGGRARSRRGSTPPSGPGTGGLGGRTPKRAIRSSGILPPARRPSSRPDRRDDAGRRVLVVVGRCAQGCPERRAVIVSSCEPCASARSKSRLRAWRRERAEAPEGLAFPMRTAPVPADEPVVAIPCRSTARGSAHIVAGGHFDLVVRSRRSSISGRKTSTWAGAEMSIATSLGETSSPRLRKRRRALDVPLVPSVKASNPQSGRLKSSRPATWSSISPATTSGRKKPCRRSASSERHRARRARARLTADRAAAGIEKPRFLRRRSSERDEWRGRLAQQDLLAQAAHLVSGRERERRSSSRQDRETGRRLRASAPSRRESVLTNKSSTR